MIKYIVENIMQFIAPNKMLLSVPGDVKQAMVVQVKFQKWLSKMKVTGTKEDSGSGAEMKSESTLCQKRANEPGEKYSRSVEL